MDLGRVNIYAFDLQMQRWHVLFESFYLFYSWLFSLNRPHSAYEEVGLNLWKTKCVEQNLFVN